MASTALQLTNLYTDTFITQDEDEVPHKLNKILCQRLEELQGVLDDIEDLNDRNNLTGKSLEYEAASWGINRDGGTDEDLQERLDDNKLRYFSGSTIIDFYNVLVAFDVQVGSHIIQNTPPESAELNIIIEGASEAEVARILALARSIKAAGVQIEVVAAIVDHLLKEDGGALTQESGDYILLDVGVHASDGRYLAENGDVFITENGDYYLQE
jgi:hypothetical protein